MFFPNDFSNLFGKRQMRAFLTDTLMKNRGGTVMSDMREGQSNSINKRL